ncbi:MAG: VPLPA-CTERM sorting domain-containing protein [Parvularcula sp.]|jgi:hypothetical protein|nr:VPLPA-CTERM sorting domain-containing protein [Parvularcula sp.]
MRRIKLALATSVFAFVGAAQAAVLEIDLTSAGIINNGGLVDPSDDGKQLVFSQLTTSGLLEIYAQALETSGSVWSAIEGLTSYQTGLGVNKGGSDDHEVDGAGQNEGIRFDVMMARSPTAVQMRRFGFTYVGSNDDVTVYGNSDGGNSLTFIGSANIGAESNSFPWPGYVDINYSDLSTVVLAAQGYNDDFKISSLKLDLGGGIDIVDEVPLPAALPIFLTGLAGLSFARRRQKQA